MASVNITEAANLTGKSTKTLYRHIAIGKLSKNNDGAIDTSELLRVYGTLRNNEIREVLNVESQAIQKEKEWLVSQIEKLQEDMRELKRESLERERRLMALLENKIGTASPAPEPVKSKLFDKIFGRK